MQDLSRFLQPVPGLFVGGATRIGLGTRLVTLNFWCCYSARPESMLPELRGSRPLVKGDAGSGNEIGRAVKVSNNKVRLLRMRALFIWFLVVTKYSLLLSNTAS